MEIFNTKILNNRQRWNRACIFAVLGTIISIIACVFVQRILSIHSSLFYIIAALFISWLILESGHGVQKKFSILAAICTVCIIFFSDMFLIFGLSAFSNLLTAFKFTVVNFLRLDFNNLLSLIVNVGAVMLAYERSRVL